MFSLGFFGTFAWYNLQMCPYDSKYISVREAKAFGPRSMRRKYHSKLDWVTHDDDLKDITHFCLDLYLIYRYSFREISWNVRIDTSFHRQCVCDQL